jgi:hypothetical protein
MKVFLSWSGAHSHLIAEKIHEWLPLVVQNIKPYFTPSDVDKGSRWTSEISSELANCNYGLLIITKDNQNAPWLLFEAGALSKNISESKVCPLLIDLKPSDIKGPLANFQHTVFTKEDMLKLAKNINDASGEQKVNETAIVKAFEKFWPDLENAVNEIVQNNKPKATNRERPERELLEELLDRVRFLSRKADTKIPNVVLQDLEDSLLALQLLGQKGNEEIKKAVENLSFPIGFILDTSGFRLRKRRGSGISKKMPIIIDDLIDDDDLPF